MKIISIIQKIFGADIIVPEGSMGKHLLFVLYLFVLTIMYMSLKFNIEASLVKQIENEQKIKDLNSEYTGKYSELLYLSTIEETENLLRRNNSTLIAPVAPPKRIKLEKSITR